MEDEEPTRELIRRTLEKGPWSVTEAENGLVGLERLGEGTFDMILLDLMMPEMDGFEFVAELAKNESWRDIPVVVITAKTITAADRERLTGRVHQLMQKSTYDFDALLADLGRILSSRRDQGGGN